MFFPFAYQDLLTTTCRFIENLESEKFSEIEIVHSVSIIHHLLTLFCSYHYLFCFNITFSSNCQKVMDKRRPTNLRLASSIQKNHKKFPGFHNPITKKDEWSNFKEWKSVHHGCVQIFHGMVGINCQHFISKFYLLCCKIDQQDWYYCHFW